VPLRIELVDGPAQLWRAEQRADDFGASGATRGVHSGARLANHDGGGALATSSHVGQQLDLPGAVATVGSM
jgi:hypothetical protein